MLGVAKNQLTKNVPRAFGFQTFHPPQCSASCWVKRWLCFFPTLHCCIRWWEWIVLITKDLDLWAWWWLQALKMHVWLSLSAPDFYNICIPPLAHFHLSVCWRHFSIRLVYKLQYSAVPELWAQEIAQLGARIHPELLSIKLFALFQVEMWELNLFGSSLDHGRAHMQGL